MFTGQLIPPGPVGPFASAAMERAARILNRENVRLRAEEGEPPFRQHLTVGPQTSGCPSATTWGHHIRAARLYG